jgi:hypothetical protein
VPDALPLDKQVWRCGNRYSGQACGAAGAKPLDVADDRTEAQRRQSQDLLAREQRLAAWYEAGRHAREAVASVPAPARPASTAPVCTSTSTLACVPRMPRARHAVARPRAGGKVR